MPYPDLIAIGVEFGRGIVKAVCSEVPPSRVKITAAVESDGFGREQDCAPGQMPGRIIFHDAGVASDIHAFVRTDQEACWSVIAESDVRGVISPPDALPTGIILDGEII